MRTQFIIGSILLLLTIGLISLLWPPILWSLILIIPLLILGISDLIQTKRAILRNFPVFGHLRYIFERFRPEIRQYFIESDIEGVPFGRDERNIIYQRAKKVRDTVSFGTIEDVYAVGYEWTNHSLMPAKIDPKSLRVTIGGPQCTQPYSASILNISAMSFGSLSSAAVEALSGGAKKGDFAHNTGEGGVSPYHLEPGGDLIWQIGTGYFGCRDPETGRFNPDAFSEMASHPHIKMVEIKLSQGAKPGKGGILPASKVTPEIAKIRMVKMGQDVISPAAHTAFSTPIELINFIQQCRELCGGKPVGIKLCIGREAEFLAICQAIHETGIFPDFIAIDGAEGGTGAAPLEFSNHIGMPLIEGLIFAHNALLGFNLRDQIKLIAAGKVTSGFGLVKRLAIGADLCYSARAMMMALGCIQARKCNTNKCPVGVATQDKNLMAGLIVSDKRERVYNYHYGTVKSAADIMGAMGYTTGQALQPSDIMRRTENNKIQCYDEIYPYLSGGELLAEPYPDRYIRTMKGVTAQAFV